MTHLEPSGAPAAGRPPPQPEGGGPGGGRGGGGGGGAFQVCRGPSSEAAQGWQPGRPGLRAPGRGLGPGPGGGAGASAPSCSWFSLCSHCGRGPSLHGSSSRARLAEVSPLPGPCTEEENAAPALPEAAGCRPRAPRRRPGERASEWVSRLPGSDGPGTWRRAAGDGGRGEEGCGVRLGSVCL